MLARLGELAAAQEQDSDVRWAARRAAGRDHHAACRGLEDALVAWQDVLTEGRN